MRSRHGLAVLGLLGVIAAFVIGLERVAPAPEMRVESVVPAAGDAVAGTWVCGFGDAREDATASIIAIRPAAAGGLPGRYGLETIEDGAVDVIADERLFPGAAVVTVIESRSSMTASILRWRSAPVATWREWSLQPTDDRPGATVAGSCAAPWAPQWFVPGLSTEGGDEARIRLTNPYVGAATVAIGFRTPTGVEEPLVLRNVTVPGRSTREIVVNETLPERGDLGAVVDVVSGRVSVEGVQLARARIGGVAGASLLAAAPAAREEWTIPWLADDDDRSSWLWVMNPGERTATVELTLHTEDGGVVPDGLAEVTVPAGQQRRVDLSGTMPEDVDVAALTGRSNGAPVVISGATVERADDPALTGIAVQLGVMPDPAWVVAGTRVDDRTEALRLVNPTSEPAVVDVRLFDGLRSWDPAPLQGLELAAGAAITVPLDEQWVGVDTWTASIEARQGAIVAGRIGFVADPTEIDLDGTDDDAAADDADDGPVAEDDVAEDDVAEDDAGDGDAGADRSRTDDRRRLVAVPGVPSASWSPRGAELRVRASDRLVLDLRTSEGLGSAQGDATGAGQDDELDGPAPGSPGDGDGPVPGSPGDGDGPRRETD